MDYLSPPDEYSADEFVLTESKKHLQQWLPQDEPRTSLIYAALRSDWPRD